MGKASPSACSVSAYPPQLSPALALGPAQALQELSPPTALFSEVQAGSQALHPLDGPKLGHPAENEVRGSALTLQGLSTAD